MERLNVAIALTGVLHPITAYTPYGEEVSEGIQEEPYGDAIPFLRRVIANKMVRVFIMSSKDGTVVRNWLTSHGMYDDEVDRITITNHFVDADMYLVDKAIRFNGQYPSLTQVWDVKPWCTP